MNLTSCFTTKPRPSGQHTDTAFIHKDNTGENKIWEFWPTYWEQDSRHLRNQKHQLVGGGPFYFNLLCSQLRVSGSFLPFMKPGGHVCGCNVCVGCVLRPGSHCASAITGYPERKESMGGGGGGGRRGRERERAYWLMCTGQVDREMDKEASGW